MTAFSGGFLNGFPRPANPQPNPPGFRRNQAAGNISYTLAGTYSFVVPEGVFNVWVIGAGGGGGGGGGTSAATGGGGGGADSSLQWERFDVHPGDVILVTVGAPGAGGIYNNTSPPATSGGTSSFGNFRSWAGGGPGQQAGVGGAGGGRGGPGGTPGGSGSSPGATLFGFSVSAQAAGNRPGLGGAGSANGSLVDGYPGAAGIVIVQW